MATEVEARFRVVDPEAVERLAAMSQLGPAELGPPSVIDETDEYLDTADRALAAARWACRLRRRGDRVIVSLKGPPDAGTGGWLHRRPELEGRATAEPIPERWPPSAARDLLDRLRGDRPLGVRLTLRQRRAERAVSIGSVPLGVLSVDDVTVVTDDGPIGGFGIVELELAADRSESGEALGELAGALSAVDGLVAEPRSKLEHALEMVENR